MLLTQYAILWHDLGMATYRKKPVEIEARQLTQGEDALSIAAWCGGITEYSGVAIPTLEGTMLAAWGDYVIKGVQGEFYPCKPDIFQATYDEVTD
jgi:hypothetical protein